MKVLNLCCAQGHLFEGWFASDDDLQRQTERGLLSCPLCGGSDVRKLPSAPRLNLGAKEAPAPATGNDAAGPPAVPADPSQGRRSEMAVNLQNMWVQAVQHVMAHTVDVGQQFPEEARRIHYGETPHRAIRGQASPDEAQALREEGIEVVTMPVPASLKGQLQ